MKKKSFVKLLAILLIIGGVIGTVGSFGFAYYLSINGFYLKLVNFEKNTLEELETISSTLHNMNTTSRNAALSLESSKQTLESAAKNLNETSKMFSKLSTFMEFELPITKEKPLKGASAYFQGVSKKSESFSLHITSLSSLIDSNSKDITVLADNFVTVADNLDGVRQSLEELHFSSIYRVIIFIMMWVGLLHLTFIIIGIALFLT